MMPGGLEMKKLVIKPMRQPRERVPIRLLGAEECPFHGIPGQAVTEVLIAGHVDGVVEADELVVRRRIVRQQRKHHQQKREDSRTLSGRTKESVLRARTGGKFGRGS